jgi:hypothetical protein
VLIANSGNFSTTVDVTGLTTLATVNVTSTAQLRNGATVFNELAPSSNSINLGNTTNRWVVVANSGSFTSTVVPVGNTVQLGNSTNRWVLTANTGDFSSDVAVSGNLSITGANVNITSNVTVQGNTTTVQNLVVGGAATQNTFSYVPFSNSNLGTNTTANVLIFSISDVSTNRSGKLTLWFRTTANNSQRTELWFTSNTTNIDYSVVGTLYTGASQPVTLLSANLNGTTVEIYGRQVIQNTYVKGIAEIVRG